MDISDYVSDVDRGTAATGYNTLGLAIVSSYSGGILKLVAPPSKVEYSYNTKYNNTNNVLMTVMASRDLTITTGVLDRVRYKKGYSQIFEAVSASGTYPITWSIIGGALPAGMTLNSSTGELRGS